MEEDGVMRRFLEEFYPNFYSNSVATCRNDVATSDNFVPSCGINTFFKNLKDALTVKRYLIYEKWEMFFAISCMKAVSSHEMYLTYVFFACEYVTGFSDDVFDALITVFAFVISYNIETAVNTGADFCRLSIDIIMVFYENALKEDFYRLGGFERFAEYLRHEYLEWKCYFDELAVDRIGSFEKRAYYKLKEKLGKISYEPEFITYDNVMENSKFKLFAKQVLTSTKNKLPRLPNPAFLKNRLRDARKCRADMEREMNVLDSTREISGADSRHGNAGADSRLGNAGADSGLGKAGADSGLGKAGADSGLGNAGAGSGLGKAGAGSGLGKAGAGSGLGKAEESGKPEVMESSLQECSNLNSNLKISNIIENGADVSQYNNIVQAVVRYNNTKFSDGANAGIQNEINKILDPLKDTINSLIEILD